MVIEDVLDPGEIHRDIDFRRRQQRVGQLS
jgi:hypothetical protein